MQRIELSKGIWFNELSPRCATITSTLPNAAPDWRVSYFGFDKWTDATKFVARLKRLRNDIKAEARKQNRLSTKYEVKVWSLTRDDVRLLKAELEGNEIETRENRVNPDGTLLYDVYLNRLRVITIHENQINRLKAMNDQLVSLSHRDAREQLVNEFLFANV